MRILKSIKFVVYLFVGLFLLQSCGLKYLPPESPVAFKERRHKVIEAYIRVNLAADSISYNSIAFGETTVIKPTSFRILDSLYEQKYQNEQKGISDKELEEIIEHQRIKVQNDTASVSYLEYHVFSYKEGDSSRMVQTQILLDTRLKVKQQEIIETILIPRKKQEYYQKYLFEESFLYPGTIATEEEERFYRFFKGELISLNALEQEELIRHTLDLMELGYKRKSVRTADLLYTQARMLISGGVKELRTEEVSDVFSTVEKQIDGSEKLVNYYFTLTFSPDEDLSKKQQYYFRFDKYLRLELMQKL